MQKVGFKFVSIFCLFIIIGFGAANAQPTATINQADSLFEAKRYTQSLELYERVLEEDFSSPSMLLKMAFITEGLERPAEALYYLNLYHIKTSDDSVLEKMDKLAEEYRVSGYDSENADFLTTVYYDYFDYIMFAALALCLLSFAWVVYEKRQNASPFAPGILSVILLAGLFYLVNYGSNTRFGIIDDTASPVMSGPSSASKVVAIARAGHKVKVIGKEDVWVKVIWNDEVAYIKDTHLKSLNPFL